MACQDHIATRAVPARVAPPPQQLVVGVKCPVDEATAHLVDALMARDLVVVDGLDPSAVASATGIAPAVTRHVLAFHPRHAARILAADPNALIETPVRFAITVAPGGATVRCNDPIATFAPYVGLRAMAEELSGVCHAVLRAVAEEPWTAGQRRLVRDSRRGRAPSAA